MFSAATRFVLDVRKRERSPWLVLLGTSGAGKTHLARRVWKWWNDCGMWYVNGNGGNSVMRGEFVAWPAFVKQCKNRDFSREEEIATAHLTILDDIGAGEDARKWVADMLHYLVESRMEPRRHAEHSSAPVMAATLITANLTLEQFAMLYDERIASRLVRKGRDKVVEVNVPDYMMR